MHCAYVLVENKPFFDQLAKSKRESFGKLVEILRSDDYAIVNLLNYFYHKTIINSRQTNTQQNNFIKK